MTQTHTHCKQVEPEQFPLGGRILLWMLFVLALLGVLVAGFFYPTAKSYFTYDGEWWFYPAIGLGVTVTTIIVARVLALILRRRVDYWEEV